MGAQGQLLGCTSRGRLPSNDQQGLWALCTALFLRSALSVQTAQECVAGKKSSPGPGQVVTARQCGSCCGCLEASCADSLTMQRVHHAME